MSLFDVTTYSACLSALSGVLLLSKISKNSIRALIFFQACTCICDLLLLFLIPMSDGAFVRLFYCFLRPIEYLVYANVLLGLEGNKPAGKYAMLSSAFIILFALYQLIFRLDNYDLTDQLMLVEGILIVMMTLIYFRGILSNEMANIPGLNNLWSNSEFWIATSLLFFFAGNIMVTGFYHKLWNHSESFTKLLYTYTNLVMGIAQSCMFVIAYIAATRKGSIT